MVDMGEKNPQAQPDDGPQPEVSAIDRVRLDPRLRTRDDSGITAITIGTLAWAVAWLVLTFGFPDAPQSWRAVSAAGFILGLIGGVVLVLRHRRMTRRRSQE